jgi:hypothetical protein
MLLGVRREVGLDSDPPAAVRAEFVDVRDTRVLGSHAFFQPSASMLESQFAPIERGPTRLAVGAAEVSLEFTADHWVVQENLGHLVVLSDAGPTGPVVRDVMLLAPTRATGTDSIDGWFEANAAMLDAASVDARLAGYAAVRFDVDRSSEGDGTAIDFITTSGGESVSFDAGFQYRVWWLDDVDGAPAPVPGRDAPRDDGLRHSLVDVWVASGGYARLRR